MKQKESVNVFKIQYFASIAMLALNFFKDTHKEKALPNQTPAVTKSMDTDIWFIGTSSQLFLTGSETETKFSKK